MRDKFAAFAATIGMFLVIGWVVGWVVILVDPYVDVLAVHGAIPLVVVGIIIAAILIGWFTKKDDEDE